MIILVGESGTGKTTILNELEKKGYTKAINHTTRAKRQGENDGIDYNYVTKQEFENLWKSKELLQRAEFKGEYYGMHTKYLDNNTACILILESIKDVKNRLKELKIQDIEIVTIYVTISEEIRIARMIARGDSADSIEKRIEIDKEKFKNALEIVDFKIENYDLDSAIKEIMKILQKH